MPSNLSVSDRFTSPSRWLTPVERPVSPLFGPLFLTLALDSPVLCGNATCGFQGVLRNALGTNSHFYGCFPFPARDPILQSTLVERCDHEFPSWLEHHRLGQPLP